MTKETFIVKFAGALIEDAGGICPQTELAGLSGWDSMGRVSFLAFLDEEFGVQPPAGALDKCKTVGDLMMMVKDRLTD